MHFCDALHFYVVLCSNLAESIEDEWMHFCVVADRVFVFFWQMLFVLFLLFYVDQCLLCWNIQVKVSLLIRIGRGLLTVVV
jgi:hypothetical protein